MLETMGMTNSSLGVTEGRLALTCLEILSSEYCHTSACLGSTSPGVPGVRYASTCPGTQFLGGQTVLTCLGIWYLAGCHVSASWESAPWSRYARLSSCYSTGQDKIQKDSLLRKSTHENISCGTVPSLSNNSGVQWDLHYLSGKDKRGPPKFTNLDLDSYEGQAILKGKFLSQCASDIRIKLPQLHQQDSAASLDETVQTATDTFYNREQER